jgi:lipopolysaccharide export system protein LptC
MNWRTGLGLALLVAALLFGWSALRHRDRPAASMVDDSKSDYIMHDFELVALDKDGKESVTLRAPEMHRSAADHTYLITTPLFLIPNRDGAHMQVRSRTAWVAAKAEKAILRDDVVGNTPPGVGVASEFRTSRLDLFPDQHLASTDQPVVLTQPAATIHGTGFELDWQTQRYTFKSEVKSRYVPKSAQ